MSGRWPNFLLIGAARSGTTALFQFLAQHPQIFTSPRKEPHFFTFVGRRPAFRGPGDHETINRAAVTDQDAYRNLFARVTTEKAIGESSVSYLYYQQAPRNIRRLLARVRILVVLRDPVQRAFSNFQYLRSAAWEPLPSFEQALAAEEERIRAGWHHIWHYRQLGYYYRQLARYYREFGAESIHPVLFDDLRSDPGKVLRGVFEFLGVDPEAEVRTDLEVNISGRPKSQLLARWLLRWTPLKRAALSCVPRGSRLRFENAVRRRLLVRESISPPTAVSLREEYRSDLEALEGLIQRDLSAWIRPHGP